MPPSHGGDTGSTPVGSTICPSDRKVRGAFPLMACGVVHTFCAGFRPMQPKQQLALELILAGHSVTDIAAQVGVRRETVWRWRNDPSFASQVSVRQAQRRQAIHDTADGPDILIVRSRATRSY